MPRFFFNPNSPDDPRIQIELAIDCDGAGCNLSFYDDQGSLVDLPPHYHLTESQPGCGSRTYAIGGELPEDIYEPAH